MDFEPQNGPTCTQTALSYVLGIGADDVVLNDLGLESIILYIQDKGYMCSIILGDRWRPDRPGLIHVSRWMTCHMYAWIDGKLVDPAVGRVVRDVVGIIDYSIFLEGAE